MNISFTHPSNPGKSVFMSHGHRIDHCQAFWRMRRKMGGSLEQLAQAVGYSVRTLEGWCQGRTISRKAGEKIKAKVPELLKSV